VKLTICRPLCQDSCILGRRYTGGVWSAPQLSQSLQLTFSSGGRKEERLSKDLEKMGREFHF
jgi:hypothetical protein